MFMRFAPVLSEGVAESTCTGDTTSRSQASVDAHFSCLLRLLGSFSPFTSRGKPAVSGPKMGHTSHRPAHQQGSLLSLLQLWGASEGCSTLGSGRHSDTFEELFRQT